VNAIFYVTKSGCEWELLPHDLPHRKTVYHYFRLWRKTGVWQAIHTALREAVRRAAGRDAQPSAAIIDSQSRRPMQVVMTGAMMVARR
jgi:putative transposase